LPITDPTIVRDYPYWAQTVPHEDADQILKIMMEDCSVSGSILNPFLEIR